MRDLMPRFDDRDAENLVLFEPAVGQLLRPFRQLRPEQQEAGGILLGYRRGSHLHVVDISLPQPTDKRSRFGFQRASHSHQAIAVSRWKASKGTIDYLGEWHTHPEQNPIPSALDLREWKAIYRERDAPMLFLIAGSTGTNWIGVGCCLYFGRLTSLHDNLYANRLPSIDRS